MPKVTAIANRTAARRSSASIPPMRSAASRGGAAGAPQPVDADHGAVRFAFPGPSEPAVALVEREPSLLVHLVELAGAKRPGEQHEPGDADQDGKEQDESRGVNHCCFSMRPGSGADTGECA
jgi:hypothetical protein